MAVLAVEDCLILLRNYRQFIVSGRNISNANVLNSSLNSSRPETHKIKTNKDEHLSGDQGDMEFRKLEIYGKKTDERVRRKKFTNARVSEPRYKQMPVDQDWVSVWPTAQSFKASVVPLPLRQGYNEKGAPPGKFGNLELMKIPNFLHLTPPAIKRHCAAIKKFCTPWPKALNTDNACEQHFPIKVITSDYCHSGPSIRDLRARIVTMQLKLSSLELDKHAKDKFMRLVEERYHPESDTLTIITDRCPLRKQNYDYSLYLLTALYHEAWKVETWETDKEEEDMEEYVWDGSKSQSAVVNLVQEMKNANNENELAPKMFQALPDNCTKEDVVKLDYVKRYGDVVTNIHNDGEDVYTLNQYKECVTSILHLQTQQPDLGKI